MSEPETDGCPLRGGRRSDALPRCLEARDLAFRYREGDFALHVPSLDVERGERVAFVGPSGSGKTTLLHLLLGILVPDAGRVVLEGEEVTALPDAGRRRLRITRVGIIFQELELLDHLTVRENVLLPFYVSRALTLGEEAEASLRDLAASLGLERMLERSPRRLSQGERQRVAICRALVTGPRVVVADEPTGNLDPRAKESMLDLVFREVDRRGATFLMVTHDHGLLGRFDRVVDVADLGGAGVPA
jgi:putative ABC transport system ATP-binding protein